jgi:acyl carrier protein
VTGLTAFEHEVAQLIVENLNLSIAPEDLKPNDPLFKEGLGLDSIDALELSLAISQKYGINIRSDDKNINQYFSSLKALSEYIYENKSSG